MDRRTFIGVLGAGAGYTMSGGLSGLGALTAPQARRFALASIPEVSPQGLTLTGAISRGVNVGAGVVDAWTLNGSVPSPTIRVRRGETASIDLVNDVPEPLIVHWHGLAVPQDADGHPRLAVDRGESYSYEYRVVNRAGTYWYHPHTGGLTAPQTYRGMGGLFIIEDDEEDSYELPSGDYEIPLVLQDKRIGQSLSLSYDVAQMHDLMHGFLGDTAFGNGVMSPTVDVRRSRYRLRILNASNARIFDLALSNGNPLTLIGGDGGLLDAPVRLGRIMLGPAERADVVVDFSSMQPGGRLMLRSLAFDVPGMMGGGRGGMGGGMSGMRGRMGRGGAMGGRMGRGRMGRGMNMDSTAMGRMDMDSTAMGEMEMEQMDMQGMMGMMGGRPSQGTQMDLLEFVVTDSPSEPGPPLPERFSPVPDRGEITGSTPRRTFHFMSSMMRGQTHHTINGRTFELERVDERIPIRQTEVWTFVNESELPHPVHMHAGQFRVLARRGGRGRIMPWETGLKDTVLVLPREEVDVAVRFVYPGLYLLHCHNLEHEDMGMMMNFEVVT